MLLKVEYFDYLQNKSKESEESQKSDQSFSPGFHGRTLKSESPARNLLEVLLSEDAPSEGSNQGKESKYCHLNRCYKDCRYCLHK